MVLAEQGIWNQLLTVSPKGFVMWRPDIQNKAGMESRNDPVRFMAMCGNLKPLESHFPTFETDDLVEVKPKVFETSQGEITGVNGLLRLIDKFPIKLKKPNNVLLVGAITPKSLLTTLAWFKIKGWNDTHLTLVDKSPVPIKTLEAMERGGYFNWQGGVSLIEEDILKFKPFFKTDLLIGDILNVWLVDNYQYPHLNSINPYLKYEQFLKWAKEIISNDGWFVSRNMIAPITSTKEEPNSRFHKTVKEKAGVIIQQLGGLAERADKQAIEESVEDLFDNPTPTSYCGLDKVLKVFRSTENLSGKHAEKIFERLQRRNFTHLNRIDVIDKNSGYVFQNYMSQ
jgi:hypothetical protein